MKEKLNKSHLSAMVKKSTTFDGEIDINDDLSFDGYFKGKFMQKKEQEISLKSIYELMITFKTEVNQKFESIDALIIKNQEDNNERFNLIDTRFNSIDNEIKAVKADVKNLDAKVTALDGEIKTVKKDVKNLDTKVSKVIELNKDIINLNKLKVSRENKTWLFGNGDDNTPTR